MQFFFPILMSGMLIVMNSMLNILIFCLAKACKLNHDPKDCEPQARGLSTLNSRKEKTVLVPRNTK
jgi:hypothetical protein